MRLKRTLLLAAWIAAAISPVPAEAETRTETFDREPANWEGLNNRSTHFAPKTVTQDFGHSPATSHAGGQPGEVGGRINPAGEPAYYGHRLPKPLTLDGPTVRQEGFWSCAAPVISCWASSTPARSTSGARPIRWWPASTAEAMVFIRTSSIAPAAGGARRASSAGSCGPAHRGRGNAVRSGLRWQLVYDPKGAGGNGLLSFTLGGETATCPLSQSTAPTASRYPLRPAAGAQGMGQRGRGLDRRRDRQRRAVRFHHRPQVGCTEQPPHLCDQKHPAAVRLRLEPDPLCRGKGRGRAGRAHFPGRLPRPASHGGLWGPALDADPRYTAGRARQGQHDSRRDRQHGVDRFLSFDLEPALQPRPGPRHPHGLRRHQHRGAVVRGLLLLSRVPGPRRGRRGPGGQIGQSAAYSPDRRSTIGSCGTIRQGRAAAGRSPSAWTARPARSTSRPGKAIGASFDRFGICTPWIDGNSVTVFFDDIEYTSGAGEK